MSHRRFNVSSTSGSFTGATTGATFNGNSLFVGESQLMVQGLSAQLALAASISGATMKAQWQGSNDASTWYNVLHSPENPAAVPLITGTNASGVNVGVPAPLGVYGYKYARCQVQWTSTTAGTTGDSVAVGYNYRQMDPGEGQ